MLPLEIIAYIIEFLPTSESRSICKGVTHADNVVWNAAMKTEMTIEDRYAVLSAYFGKIAAARMIARTVDVRKLLVNDRKNGTIMEIYEGVYCREIFRDPISHADYIAIRDGADYSDVFPRTNAIILFIVPVINITMAISVMVLTVSLSSIVQKDYIEETNISIFTAFSAIIYVCVVNIISLMTETIYRIIRDHLDITRDVSYIRDIIYRKKSPYVSSHFFSSSPR